MDDEFTLRSKLKGSMLTTVLSLSFLRRYKMKIVSWNLNGLKATLESGSFVPIEKIMPDILCLQEIRCADEPVVLGGYNHYWNHAAKDGYSGTAVLTRKKPISVQNGLGDSFPDDEGRVITVELPKFYVVNAYVPNAQKNLKKHDFRMRWDEAFREYVCGLNDNKPVIICGDFNVARSEIDIYAENMRQYWAEQGYISDERSNFETLLECGFVDAYRELNPETRSYTWWSNRLNKRSQGRGWRLDYFLVAEELMPSVVEANHLVDLLGSDHCPIDLVVRS
jgi:exodeoxyribonuclease-3